MYTYKQYHHNKVAQLLFDISFKGAIYLHKHKWLYWILQFTWNLIPNIIYFLILVVVFAIKHKKIQILDQFLIIFIGNNWGGVSLSLGALIANNMSEEWTKHTIYHERGHAYQAAMGSIFYLFIVAIPSVIRWVINHYKKLEYESIRFEHSASAIGEYLFHGLPYNSIYPDKSI